MENHSHQDKEDKFTEEEMHLGVTIFTALYWLTIFLLFAAIVTAIYLGFKGVLWYVAIPCWAACNFGLRVTKRYFRNILESFENDLKESAHVETDEAIHEPIDIQTASNPKGIAHSSFLVITTMLTVSALWYGIGLMLGIAF